MSVIESQPVTREEIIKVQKQKARELDQYAEFYFSKAFESMKNGEDDEGFNFDSVSLTAVLTPFFRKFYTGFMKVTDDKMGRSYLLQSLELSLKQNLMILTSNIDDFLEGEGLERLQQFKLKHERNNEN